MTSPRFARGFFGLNGLVVLVGMIIQLSVSAGLKGTQFHSPGARIFNVFCYFTVWSNIAVGVTTGMLAWRLERPSEVFRVVRLAGLISITITFVLFHIALAHLQELQGSAKVADTLLHTVCPIMALVGWLAFGPRGMLSPHVVLPSLLFAGTWMVFALIRGPIVDFYAYPFADPRKLGYFRVAVNAVGVAALWLLLGTLASYCDRFLPPRKPQAPQGAPAQVTP
ncbi:MAG TPA: Pr6Pr family membrane protein [Frankiaceae bacterium]|jgi:hypothetical protein|nr:Pr6Pr family membrane protein [Frankiaceae bacterium]